MGIESQAMHDHANDAQPSSSDTPVAPQSAQFISADRMVQDLEHRVSKLEGIGVRNALAVLKDDMSKLQPNLSIFDAPLPEDESFEDELAKTDEEELEEEHVKKEINEDRQIEVSIQRSMDDVTTRMVGVGSSSLAPTKEDADTTEITTATKSKEDKDS
ncbi:hypothetical protein HAX54_015843 [Datura stramonium]|uniref:Uncharacterized protein n=1 Tax=Datura stramonium TaxID=4076 RepID=A0ABS8UK46_DATST|nr:hypothetical protein [Datura stramonium]